MGIFSKHSDNMVYMETHIYNLRSHIYNIKGGCQLSSFKLAQATSDTETASALKSFYQPSLIRGQKMWYSSAE